MKEGIVFFTRPKESKPLANIIMKCEGTDFSHSAFAWWSDKYGRLVIYEATGSEIGFVSQGIFFKRNEIVKAYKVEMLEDEFVDAGRFCMDSDGKKYGFKSMIGLGIMRLAKWLGLSYPSNPFADGVASMVCTELVMRILGIGRRIDLENEADSAGLQELAFYVDQFGVPCLSEVEKWQYFR